MTWGSVRLDSWPVMPPPPPPPMGHDISAGSSRWSWVRLRDDHERSKLGSLPCAMPFVSLFLILLLLMGYTLSILCLGAASDAIGDRTDHRGG
jgi:hypothetical protein